MPTAATRPAIGADAPPTILDLVRQIDQIEQRTHDTGTALRFLTTVPHTEAGTRAALADLAHQANKIARQLAHYRAGVRALAQYAEELSADIYAGDCAAAQAEAQVAP